MSELVALVTGASRGIGKAVAELLSESGFTVIGTYCQSRDETSAKENFSMRPLDICDAESCAQLYDSLMRENNMPQLLVNNAGINLDAPFHKMDCQQWESVLNTNLLSMYRVTHPAFLHMRSQGYGRIVNLSSVNANKGQFGQCNYTASKAGVQGFTKSLALEGAGYGITVNSVSPGYTDTDMVSSIREEIREKICSSIPAKRFCKPSEVAFLVNFLCSEKAGYINGANYEINGAMY